MGEEDIHHLIEGCIRQDRKSQKLLYKALYGFAMGICLRYAGNRYEATETMNSGFLKVFTHIGKYDADKPFKAWLGRIMMNTSIDYYRANLKTAYTEELDKADYIGEEATVSSKLGYDELLRLVQQLPETYRAVFNLFAIDGYTHDEIGEMLGIHPGTSKSNLHKARQKLQSMIAKTETEAIKKHINNNTNTKHIMQVPIRALKQVAVAETLMNSWIRR